MCFFLIKLKLKVIPFNKIQIDISKFKVDLTKKPSDMKTNENSLRDIIHNWEVRNLLSLLNRVLL